MLFSLNSGYLQSLAESSRKANGNRKIIFNLPGVELAGPKKYHLK